MGRGGGLPTPRRSPPPPSVEISWPIHPFPTPAPPPARRGEERRAGGGEPSPLVVLHMGKNIVSAAGRDQNSLSRPRRWRKTPPEEAADDPPPRLKRPRKGKAVDGDRLLFQEGVRPLPPRRLQIQTFPLQRLQIRTPLPHWGAKRLRSALGRRRDWSDLDDGPAGLIAERVLAGGDVADYIRFRAVCRPWRRCCAGPRTRAILEDSRLHPRRWVMLPGEWGEKLTAADAPHCTRRCFLNFSTGQCVQVEIPELRDHGVLRSSTEGLLLLVAQGATGAVRLLNPLTRQAAELPPITGLDITKAHIGQLSPNNASIVDDGRRVLLYHYEKEGSILAFAKPGDEHWVLVKKATNDLLMPTLSFAGRFFGVTLDSVMVVDTTARGEDAKLAVAARLATPIRELMTDTGHLVEIAGELMLVHRKLRRVRGASGEYNDFKETYKLYRVNLATGKVTPAAARGHTIFLGKRRSLAVPAQVFPSLSTNTVYNFVMGCGPEITAYHLRDGSTETFKCHESGPLAHPWNIADCLAAYVSG